LFGKLVLSDRKGWVWKGLGKKGKGLMEGGRGWPQHQVLIWHWLHHFI